MREGESRGVAGEMTGVTLTDTQNKGVNRVCHAGSGVLKRPRRCRRERRIRGVIGRRECERNEIRNENNEGKRIPKEERSKEVENWNQNEKEKSAGGGKRREDGGRRVALSSRHSSDFS